MQTTIQFPTRKRTAGRQTVKRNLSLVDIENSPVKRPRTEGESYQNARQALHTALPESIVGRESEISSVSSFLDEHISKKQPGSLYISGAPGTGKTAVVSKSIESLQLKDANCKTIYINCMSLRNSQSIFNSVISSMKNKELSLSVKDATTQIEKFITCTKTPSVLVLDEIDSLDTHNQDVLYTIFEWPALPKSSLVLIGIANSLDLTDRILPRLQARPNCRPDLLNFTPYSREEIAAVITDRLSKLVDNTILDPAAIQFCARKVSSMAGDIRMALDVCRRAVEVVEMETKKKSKLEFGGSRSPSKLNITQKVGVAQILKIINEVYGARVTAQSDKVQTIPLQQMLAICTLLLMTRDTKSKEVTLGKFHESYCRVCVRNGVNKIDQSEFLSMCTLIEARGLISIKRTKETRSFKISLKMDEKELEVVMQDKTMMSSILQKGLL